MGRSPHVHASSVFAPFDTLPAKLQTINFAQSPTRWLRPHKLRNLFSDRLPSLPPRPSPDLRVPLRPRRRSLSGPPPHCPLPIVGGNNPNPPAARTSRAKRPPAISPATSAPRTPQLDPGKAEQTL